MQITFGRLALWGYDVDIHRRGYTQRRRFASPKYPIVLTEHHPEYISEEQMDTSMTTNCRVVLDVSGSKRFLLDHCTTP